MAARFKVGDKVRVPENKEEAKSWWRGKAATVRAVLDDGTLYEVLFDDAQDFDFIEEPLLAPAGEPG
jgi:hypothetical protein